MKNDLNLVSTDRLRCFCSFDVAVSEALLFCFCFLTDVEEDLIDGRSSNLDAEEFCMNGFLVCFITFGFFVTPLNNVRKKKFN